MGQSKIDKYYLNSQESCCCIFSFNFKYDHNTLSGIPTFCVEGQLWILEFGYFVLIEVIKKPRNPEAELQGLAYFGRTTTCIINYQIQ